VRLAVTICLALLSVQNAAPRMRTIDKGTQSGIEEARTVVVRTADEWQKLWRAHAAGKPVPAVDFSQEMVVGVFAGQRPTAGYSVEIVGIRDENGGLVVDYRSGSPTRDAITAQVLTAPYDLVAVPKRAGEVRFEPR